MESAGEGLGVDAKPLNTLCCAGALRGGVMLVHNIRRNETRVIDFRETAPAAISEEMLLTKLHLNVRGSFFGLSALIRMILI